MKYQITIASEMLKDFTVFAETEEEAQDRAFEKFENWQRRRSDQYGDPEIYLSEEMKNGNQKQDGK